MKADVEGIVNQLSIKPEERLLPVFEAIANSFDSLQLVSNSTRTIKVLFDIYDDNILTDDTQENRKIKNVKIVDNGVGFTDVNMDSFESAFKSIKSQTGAKGVGRFTWLKIFRSALIESVYEQENKKYKRVLTFDKTGDGVHKEDPILVSTDTPIETQISLQEMLQPYNIKPVKSFQEIVYDVIDHFIDLLDTNHTDVTLYDTEKNESYNLNHLYKEEYQSAKVEKKLSIGSQEFVLKHFRVNKTDHKHALICLAHNRKVTAERLSRFFPELTKAIDDNGIKYYYLGLLSSDYLDKNVSATRKSFNIPTNKEDTDLINDVSLEEIFESTKAEVASHLCSVLSLIRTSNFDKIVKKIQDDRRRRSGRTQRARLGEMQVGGVEVRNERQAGAGALHHGRRRLTARVVRVGPELDPENGEGGNHHTAQRLPHRPAGTPRCREAFLPVRRCEPPSHGCLASRK